MPLTNIATYQIQGAGHPFRLTIAQGSVLDFSHPRGGIVNAANEGCLGGGGVDGAISNAGGPNLQRDRERLPEIRSGVRCPTGKAVITGPGSYGKLEVPYVVHAVGPNYLDCEDDELAVGDKLLASAYTSSLECGRDANLEAVAFCLLSAGIFRGARTVKEVLRIGLKAICQFEGYDGLKEVHVCGFTNKELAALVAIAGELGLKKADATNDGEEGEGEAPKKEDTQQNTQKNGENGGQQDDQEQKKAAAEDTREEWEIGRDEAKAEGDNHFRAKSYAKATKAYADALQFDPTNHIILSNKSAAHLANGEKSKALHDAKKCVEHAGKWAKGHTRLAAAMASLGRYNEAAGVYSKVLNELEPNNAVAKKGLEDCRAKQRQAREQKEKEARQLQAELDKQKAEKEDEENEKEKADEGTGDDLLDDFFSEVEQVAEKKPKPAKEEASDKGQEESGCRIKTQISDLGSSLSQIDRLLQVNYEWKNLNPFYVLDVPHTIDDESVLSARYRALSLLVHPDKCPDDPVRAKTAFEQVKKAFQQMNDDNKRRHVQALVEQGMKQGKRDWEAEKAKGISVGDLANAQNRATMKIFAEIEQKRRNIEKRKHEYEQRERAQEDEEKAKEKNEREHDRKWREGERVDKRVGNWRDFSKGGKKGKFS
ncbi:hypothetical protein ACHAXT_004064 [Thalassiosira profunda]